MNFTKEFLLDSLDDANATVYDKIVDHSRWSIHFERVFKHEGKFYRTNYSRGATEVQDERAYDYQQDAIECPEVVPVEKLVTVYEEKS